MRKTIVLWLAFVPFLASAQTFTGRLARIKESKTLIAAYREQSIPFSYLDHGMQVGFGVELTQRIAAALRTQLGEPDIHIRWNAVTLSTRIPLVASGNVDIECATTTHTREREQYAGFSVSYFLSADQLAVRRNGGFSTVERLGGKRIAVAAGSTTEKKLEALAAKGNPATEIVVARSNAEAAHQLDKGEVDAYAGNDVVLAGELMKLPHPEAFERISMAGTPEPYACMLPKDDPAFKALVDRVLGDMMHDGEMETLYRKWFQSPIAPYGRSLNMQLDDALRNAYRSPNDHPL